MRKVFIPYLFVMIHYVLQLQVAHAQNYEHSGSYEISVHSVSARFAGIHYSFAPMGTRSYPEVHQKVSDGWIYEIVLKIKLSGEKLVWNTPFGVTLIFPDGSRQNVIINNESNPLYSNNLYEFRFNVNCRRKGWA